MHHHYTYWQIVWRQFCRRPIGVFALVIVALFIVTGIYAPLLASSKPLVVKYDGQWFFPLFHYLFFPGFFTKRLDIFYNLLMFFFPLYVLSYWIEHKKKFFWTIYLVTGSFIAFFIYLIIFPPSNPAFSPLLQNYKQNTLQEYLNKKETTPFFATQPSMQWNEQVALMTPFAKLLLVLNYQQELQQHRQAKVYETAYYKKTQSRNIEGDFFPTLWNLNNQREQQELVQLDQTLAQLVPLIKNAHQLMQELREKCAGDLSASCNYLNLLPLEEQKKYRVAKSIEERNQQAHFKKTFIHARRLWLDEQTNAIQYKVMPLVRDFHWEDDAGGDQILNHLVDWKNVTRINRKDMMASLIFGIRISLSVGLLAISLALAIGVPIGALAGYYGGKLDLVTYRLIEIWESMPTFFMLLMIVAFFQSKSIFLVIAVIGLFGWTNFSRFIRGEFLRQKQLTYIEACRAMGYHDRKIIFSHILPNALPPLLTLIPFAITGAIASEAGLSFLGLGEEGSNSWGVLMDEGRTAFPSESYLLWPPAILLTLLLISIALVGDSLRDALDPKLHKT